VIEMDETFAEAHHMLAQLKHLFDSDWQGAEREFRRSGELNPKIRAFLFSRYAGLLAAEGEKPCLDHDNYAVHHARSIA